MAKLIPKLIHFAWIGSEFPEWARRHLDEWMKLNPEYDVLVHTEQVLLPKLQQRYDEVCCFQSKADLLRYSALARYGGWAIDIDFWPLRPLDDAVRAWELDGTKLFMSKQRGNHNIGLPFANGLLAAAKDNWVVQKIIDIALATPANGSRVVYGPRLMNLIYREYRRGLIISEPGWWFPLSIQAAAPAYKFLLAGVTGTLRHTEDTGGQLPFAVHMWASANNLEQLMKDNEMQVECARLALVQRAARNDHPLNAISVGLERCGFLVQRADPNADESLFSGFIPPSVSVVWNPIIHKAFAEESRRRGVPVLCIEHGFFKRRQYSQVDHRGFLHWSSLADDLRAGRRLPEDAADRLRVFYPNGIKSSVPRKKGYVLVLGQVSGDTQMNESELTGPVELQAAVYDAKPSTCEFYFRPHPLCSNVVPHPRHRTLPLIRSNVTAAEMTSYKQTQMGTTLLDDLRGARFIITINSNAINEVLAEGIPTLAFGPHLAIEAGVCMETSRRTLKSDIRKMLAGWAPSTERVEWYLRWLAARQWSCEELQRPEYVRLILERAGVFLEK